MGRSFTSVVVHNVLFVVNQFYSKRSMPTYSKLAAQKSVLTRVTCFIEVSTDYSRSNARNRRHSTLNSLCSLSYVNIKETYFRSYLKLPECDFHCLLELYSYYRSF